MTMRVDDWVLQLRGSPVERFYPTAAAKATGLPVEDVFRQLLGLVSIGWLSLGYELRCPECASAIETAWVKDPTSLYGKTLSCDFCGVQDIEIASEHIFPVFYINADWRSDAKKGPAANGLRRLPVGGDVSLGQLVSRQNGITIVELVLPGEGSTFMKLLDQLDEVSKEVTELRSAVNVIREAISVPRDKEERKRWIARLKQLGETFKIWLDIGKDVGLLLLLKEKLLQVLQQLSFPR